MSKARDGGTHRTTNIDPKMMIDIQMQVSRLVAKAGQLIGNSTTNLAECWMHMRTKLDGGKLSIGHKVGHLNIVVWELVCE